MYPTPPRGEGDWRRSQWSPGDRGGSSVGLASNDPRKGVSPEEPSVRSIFHPGTDVLFGPAEPG